MRTFVTVLVLEVDETEGNPANWDWSEIINTPGSVHAPQTVELEPEPTDAQVELFVNLTLDYRNAVRDTLGVVEEVEPRCDVCDVHTEEADDWCGDCGNCSEHCADEEGCKG